MTTVVALLLLLLSCASLYGWGALVRKLAGNSNGPWPATIGLGLALVVALGGLANVARIAYAPLLWVIFVPGLVLCVRHTRGLKFSALAGGGEIRGGAELLSAAVLIAIFAIFTIATQLPPQTFNYHDDFQKYFAHPVRMLATGTLAGSPLSALGSETLGGQAFLHGFVHSVLPLPYINGVDAVFGLLLLMMLAASAGWRRLGPFPGAALGPLAVAVVNPQYTNVSALFLGAALVATAVMLTADERETSSCAPPLPLGLVFAAMIALKTTFALFVVLYLPLSALALGARAGSWKNSVAWGARVVLWTAVALSPWSLLHLPNYAQVVPHAGGAVPKALFEEQLNLLSVQPLFYGATQAHYTALTLVAAIAGAMAAVALRRCRTEKSRATADGVIATAVTAIVAFLILVPAMGPLLGGYDTSQRYAIPILLGTTVMAALYAAGLPSPLPRAAHAGVLALALVAICASFAPAMISRCSQAARFGSILAFSRTVQDPGYLNYNEVVLADSNKEFLNHLQTKVPDHEPLLAWIGAPFQLDYRRNPICDAESAGLATAWAHIPRNVQYALWEYRGYGVRQAASYQARLQFPGGHERLIAARALAFWRRMEGMRDAGQVLYDDGHFVLFKIAPGIGS